MPDLGENLVGTWRLRSWEAVGVDGAAEHPLGEPIEGLLVYTADGHMMTTIGRAGRPPIMGGDILAGATAERLAALESFIAYSGTYQVDGDDVVHHVAMSLFPNWVGTVQRRHVTLSADGCLLTLSTDPMVVRGREGRQHLAWERVAEAASGTAAST